MKNFKNYTLILGAAITLSLASCTFGDKGEEGRTDSAVVDTNIHTSEKEGLRGTGIDTSNESVHGRENSMLKDSTATDTARKNQRQ
jgi:hypothetical protein